MVIKFIKENNNIKNLFLNYILIFIPIINGIFSENSESFLDIVNSECLNAVLILNHNQWRSGHASTNKNGDTIIEFSIESPEGKSRLFYGLRKNGRYFFQGAFFKEIEEMNCDDCDNSLRGRYESRNLFVSLNNDTAKTKQYLFSMTSFNGLVELIDIENNFDYHSWNNINFFELNSTIFSFEYLLFELEESNTYITAFRILDGLDGENEEYSNTIMVKKFSVESFNSGNHYSQIKSVSISNAYNDRVVSAFQLDITKLIIVLYVTNNSLLNFIYYNDSLEFEGEKPFTEMHNLFYGYGMFFKGIPMKNDTFVLAYYNDGHNGRSLSFQLRKYESMIEDDPLILSYNFSSYEFREDAQTNGLFKLSDERLVLFSASDGNNINYGFMHMFLIYFYNNYEGMKMREFIFHYPGKRFSKEMCAHEHNGFILFSATLESPPGNDYDVFSFMLIFGFANGTDLKIDIYPFLMDTNNYNETNNLYDFLIEKIKIDNNIFGYEIIEKIKLISICDELLLYHGKLGINNKQTFPVLNGSFDANHTLIQNKNITKEEDKLYMLEYQYIVKEPDYTTFYSKSCSQISSPDNYDGSEYFQPKIFYGRTNQLQFKLCHRYCLLCNEYGISDKDQKCLNCKKQNENNSSANVGNFTGNCIPYNEECKYGSLINYTSSYSNLSNGEILNIIKKDIFSNYCLNGSKMILEGANGNVFQVSNTIIEKMEIEVINDDSTIDLKECENILKEVYHINNRSSLILLKYLIINDKNEKQVIKYEVYHPHTYELLNLSKCENEVIDIYVPLILEKNLEQLYDELLNQGYNPLDLSDKFYIDICTPYTTENGTDMILDDREEFIYNLLVNKSLCPYNCYYSGYNPEKKQIKCECNKNDVSIVNLDLKHLSGSNIYKSFLSTLKATNYEVLTCLFMHSILNHLKIIMEVL